MDQLRVPTVYITRGGVSSSLEKIVIADRVSGFSSYLGRITAARRVNLALIYVASFVFDRPLAHGDFPSPFERDVLMVIDRRPTQLRVVVQCKSRDYQILITKCHRRALIDVVFGVACDAGADPERIEEK